jgi:hypothetical protein
MLLIKALTRSVGAKSLYELLTGDPGNQAGNIGGSPASRRNGVLISGFNLLNSNQRMPEGRCIISTA